MNLNKCQIIELPRIYDSRGNLTFIEANNQIPFDVRRVFYLYDVPGGSERGAHAHKTLQQCIIAVSGSFDFHLDDGAETKTVHMNRGYYGLYLCPMIWGYMDNFSSGAVCMSLASDRYDENDYYRDYNVFLQKARAAAQ